MISTARAVDGSRRAGVENARGVIARMPWGLRTPLPERMHGTRMRLSVVISVPRIGNTAPSGRGSGPEALVGVSPLRGGQRVEGRGCGCGCPTKGIPLPPVTIMLASRPFEDASLLTERLA